MLLFQRTWVRFSAPIWWLTTSCNCSSEGPTSSSDLRGTRCTCGAQIHTHAKHPCTHSKASKKTNKKPEQRRVRAPTQISEDARGGRNHSPRLAITGIQYTQSSRPSSRDAQVSEPGLHGEFQVNQGYPVRPCVKRKALNVPFPSELFEGPTISLLLRISLLLSLTVISCPHNFMSLAAIPAVCYSSGPT